jgi:hypothetical protein
VFSLAALACNLPPLGTATPTTPPIDLPIPTPEPTLTEPPGPAGCTLTAEADLSAYFRPHPAAEVFGTLQPGVAVEVLARTPEGWLGFDPGVAQAGNVGVFRLRWVQEGPGLSLSGECGALPVVVGPPPGVCFAMAMAAMEVHEAPDATSPVLAIVPAEGYAAALARTAAGWVRVDLGMGQPGQNLAGWIAPESVNLNGPCDLPTVSGEAGSTFSPSNASCTITASSDVPVYNRPSTQAQEFGTFSAGLSIRAAARTADGWIGFEPGVAQAANIGIFRLRWVQEGPAVSLSGDCGALPVVTGPPPGVCFTMPMMDTPVHEAPLATSTLLGTLVHEQYAAVTAVSAAGWYRVDPGLGNAPSVPPGWIPPESVNFNGPCEGFPVVAP